MGTKLGKILCSSLIVLLATASSSFAEPSHGIAMRGQPALPADYTHFPYANPDAPKGGKLTYGVYGTFDDLNPFDLQSIRTGARGLWVRDDVGHVVDPHRHHVVDARHRHHVVDARHHAVSGLQR